jgi:hypothetical protein
MKIRNGFVSNSSSSSFILEKSKKYPDAYSLASKMVYYREYEDDEKLAQKTIVAVRKRKLSKLNGEEVQFNCENVSFSSCNYDTYIVDYEDYLIVETCNNHDWDDFYGESISHRDLSEEFKEKFVKKMKDGGYFEDYDEEDEEEFYWDEIYGLNGAFNFYSLEHDKVGKRSKGYRTCDKCEGYIYYMEIDGVDQCPICGDTSQESKY